MREQQLQNQIERSQQLIEDLYYDSPIEELKTHLENGASVNYENDHSQATPLHIAALKENHEAIKLFLDNGADPNKTDSNGNSALIIAAKNNDYRCLKSLLKANPDINITNNYNDTALSTIISDHRDVHYHNLNLLLNHGAITVKESDLEHFEKKCSTLSKKQYNNLKQLLVDHYNANSEDISSDRQIF